MQSIQNKSPTQQKNTSRGNNKLFMDVRNQIFYKHKGVINNSVEGRTAKKVENEQGSSFTKMPQINKVASSKTLKVGTALSILNQEQQKDGMGNLIDDEIGALQSNMNQLTKPKNVINMLKDRQEMQNKQRVIQMQENNIHM